MSDGDSDTLRKLADWIARARPDLRPTGDAATDPTDLHRIADRLDALERKHTITAEEVARREFPEDYERR